MAVNTKDKYYTPEWLVKHTVKKAVEIIGKENITDIIEPSAGDGAFIEELDKLAKELGVNVGYYDLYPSHPRIIKMDYKKLIKSYKKGRLIIGNPPFGTSSSLWKAFCKKSAKIGDFIAFVSPASQYKSNYYFKEGELIYSELLNDVEYRGDKEYGGKDQKVRTCLNIYKVYDREEEEDWRIARLEQDILIKSVFTTGDFRNKDFDADFYVGSWGWGCLGKYEDNKVYAAQLGIKILDESKREQITDFFKTYRENNITDEYVDGKHLSIKKVKQQLIKHLYPTREERLEQDVLIVKEDENPDYYMTYWGDAGHIDKIKKTSCVWPIKILNENIRQRFESSFDIIKQKINEHPTLNIGTGGSKIIKEIPMKEVLIDILYDDDPSFSEYEDFDYPEIRKPVHVERAVHGKPLIPIEYREEIVKTPKEETKVAAVALF